jgi:hypothetical protein
MWNMKYLYPILLLMAGVIAMVVVVALILIGLSNINQDTSETLTQTTPVTILPRSTPPPRLTVTPTPAQSNQDPILGSWLNGMIFYANGTVGGDGKTSWKANENENNSYFILSEVPSEGTTEWIYNPASDKINKRGSSESISRGIPKPVPTPIPAITTIRTQLTQGINTTITQKKFSYSDCVDVCKRNYWADHQVGYYNDCLNTCNIENLKASN